jgi:chromosomal replication initiator protein
MLIHLQAQSSLTGAEISIDMARTLLKQSAAEEGNHYTVENIQHAAAKFFHLKPSDLKSASRAQSIALPRQIAIYLIRKYTGMGYKDLAQIFGGKDHTTMIHAVKKIEQGIQANTSLREQVEGVQNLL